MTGIDPYRFLTKIADAGFVGLTGVPCSSMTSLISAAQASEIIPYKNAPNEGEALAYVAGVWLGGGSAAMLCQNSGLGNLLNVLTSLLVPYRIPALILSGWRGEPGNHDEPQHQLMGAISPELLRLAGASVHTLASEEDVSILTNVFAAVQRNRQVAAVLVSAGTFAIGVARFQISETVCAGTVQIGCQERIANRRTALTYILGRCPAETPTIITTGLLSREYWSLADRTSSFYMVGAMGHAISVAVGVATASDLPMLIIDGDGAILMRPSGLLFAGGAHLPRLSHVVFDNGIHESTGGQPTLSPGVDLALIAKASGYSFAVDTADLSEAVEAMKLGLSGGGPVFIRLRIKPGGTVPPRISLQLEDIASRFRSYISSRKTSFIGC